jgi:predicted amino acid dehydrogenase
VHGDVVEGVAEDRPQELALRIGRFAQRLHALDRILFLQDAGDDVIGLGAARDVVTLGEVERRMSLPTFL